MPAPAPAPAMLPDTPAPLDPRVLRTWRIGALLGMAFVAPIGVAVARWRDLAWGPSLAAGVTVAGALALIEAWLAGLRYRRWRWHVDDVALVLDRGGIVRRVTTIPRFRLQHVDVRRGPLETRHGLATLVLHVAGGGDEHEIPGLPVATAEAVRDALVHSLHARWVAEVHDVADGVAASTAPAPPAPGDA